MGKQKPIRLVPMLGLILLVVVTYGLFLRWISQTGESDRLPQAVNQWRPQVIEQMDEQGLSREWIDLLMAQLMQESGGREIDLFQCSESKYGVPGMIQSEEESIEQAVFYWIKLIHRAQEIQVAPSPENLLQAYNMGIGYLDYLMIRKSDTSEAIARTFSAEVLGGGGDPRYVTHVLRYLERARKQ